PGRADSGARGPDARPLRWRKMARFERVAARAVEPTMADTTNWAFPTALQPDAAAVDFDLPRALNAVVRLAARIPDDAFTAPLLGTEREGTGVVIGADGLIITIGYLILEAASILVVTRDGRVYPAVIAGFDHATGFGLLRAHPDVARQPLELGVSSEARELHTAYVVTHPSAGGCSRASIVSRRRFTGWWEYMLDEAIFTAPPRHEHSGAALVDASGRLIGIGSLWVSDALAVGAAFPGNMFVPTDLLKPLLEEGLAADSGRRKPARPWLGVYSEEREGHVVVTRVLPDSPAEQAGMRRGDVILGVGGQSVGGQHEFYRKLWACGAAGTAITLHVLQNRKVRHFIVHSADRLDYLRPWKI
ncbi:MAG: serine protease, partial [Burkholderiales bacterium]|nr:serine protease [Burkholderiales bacterium]